jgi:hypothetical protein
MTAALFADVDITDATLQNVFPMTRITHLAAETASRGSPVYALESARMLTFMVLLQSGKDLFNSHASLVWEKVRGRISLNYLFCSFLNSVDICCFAPAILPFNTTDIAKLCATDASRTVS